MNAPGWAKQLAGIDPNSVTSRAALAKLPVLRKSDLPRLQTETPPFGGFNVTPPGKAKRLLMSPGPIFEPEGHARDFAGVARAMFAAGFREGQIVLNCFSYHLTPGAWMFESAARGARLRGDPRRRRQYRAAGRGDRAASPDGYTGTPDFLKILLDTAQTAGKDASSLKRGLVSGAALAAVAAAGIVVARGRGAAMLCRRRNRRDRL